MGEQGEASLKIGVYGAILLFGVVSLMGDVVYEGSRGLVPDYLKFLGASALVVSAVSGLGEFIGYALRIVSGYLSDVTKSYWLFTFLGYGLIIAVPLLSLGNMWTIAVLLIILERVGKAIRTPARDTLLSIIGRGSKTGRVFGIHEFFDQIGAVIGPLIMSTTMLYTGNNYQVAFGIMFVPYTVLILTLFYTFNRVGPAVKVEVDKPAEKRTRFKLSPGFKTYSTAVFLNTMGLIPVSLILYKASVILSPGEQQWIVPLLYLIVQAVDAPIALVSGYFYDKYGLKILLLPFILSIVPSTLAFLGPSLLVLALASIFFGIVLGMQESIYRAAVSDLVATEARGTAYGVFQNEYGLGMLVGGFAYGFFTDVNLIVPLIFVYTVSLQAVATFLLMKTVKV